MKKKLILWGSCSAVVAILVLWTILRYSPVGATHNFAGMVVAILLSILAFPIRLYVIFFLGENGSWPIPLLVLFLILTGLTWGVVIERVSAVFRRA